MQQVVKMTDLGEMSFFLGMEVKQKNGEIFISQRKYSKEILKKFSMENCKSMNNSYVSKEEVMQR